MIRFADSATVPTAAQLTRAIRANIGAWAGYLPVNPYATQPWTAKQLTSTRDAVGALLPVYVAPYPARQLDTADAHADAARALDGLAAIGGLGGPVCADIERALWDHNPAEVIRWFAAFRAGIGTHAIVIPYGAPATLLGLGQHSAIPAVWAASWLTNPPAWPTANTPPGLGTAWAGHRAWQLHGNTTAFGGLGVDLNLADPAFPFLRHHTATPTPAPAPAPRPTIDATVVVGRTTYRGRLTA